VGAQNVIAAKDVQRQIAIVVVVSVKKAPFLFAVQGQVGGVHVQHITAVIRDGHILCISRRAIPKGEELTLDYCFAKDIERVRCKCGSDWCRGTINLIGP
jgi:hypothetical protein